MRHSEKDWQCFFIERGNKREREKDRKGRYFDNKKKALKKIEKELENAHNMYNFKL